MTPAGLAHVIPDFLPDYEAGLRISVAVSLLVEAQQVKR